MNDRVEILVAEDSRTQAEQLRYLLEEHGYGVRVAGDGRVALAAVRERRPTLVISDIVMPQMDGYEMCKRLKSDDGLRDIPVILLTSLSDPEDIIRGLEAGADCYCTKPYDEEHLLSRIDFLLANPIRPGRREAEEGIEVVFAGNRHVVTSGRQEILNLLLSTYESAVRQNRQLIETQRELEILNEELENRVAERTRELAQRAEELARSSAELERLAYITAHDLQEPLRSVASFTQLLARRYQGKFDQEADRFISRSVAGVERMKQLLGSLLAYLQVSSRDQTLTPVRCAELLDRVLDGLKITLQESGAVVTHDPLPTVRADAAQLTQILQNLIENAIKFRGDRPPEIHLSAERQDSGWIFAVRDKGIGLEARYAGRIFDLFERLHARGEYEGTGMGLAICKKIAENHGGRIWVESEPGKGSTFFFTIPDRGDTTT